jgi:hypothetical protein
VSARLSDISDWPARFDGQAKAERLLAEELRRVRWTEADLRRHRKGDGRKLKMALRLRRETTMTLSWIAKRLQMGTKTHLSRLLYWQTREQREADARKS